ncbi:dipeptide ABC transporter ATP-binding protein [Brevibacillus centrosporus]|uniref:ABC transporter ATP-binding protein n=1 Tax=Brevibacillus centrosporus TaxID=54910 RepID=UPI000F0A3B2D|nr:dipeptide ABC transporter ATP-binding protein [Brevibacillus centrosporus]MEC2132286.1 dipeptide ABC transporter ATP-binding protein [Brevibacillus centrosporus]RNB72377.1 dipeptide ABC transporter ATP-binding protein [Brevibacillus centrosporus]GED33148.1 ABC transporter ATP-binding protein [Brevibacillus centrosporus]
MSEDLLVVDNLKTYFPLKKGLFGQTSGHVKAVDGVSFKVKRGETLGIVGESGCGKSTTGRSILQLIKPSAGSVRFHGEELIEMPQAKLRDMRSQMQIIFQDPYSSLNPRLTVATILAEALSVGASPSDTRPMRERVIALLLLVGLNPQHADRYPHEFSGGQRQRIGIARAIAVSPKLIVADEPVSALDVSIQAQILNLMKELQEDMGLTYLFISHDLGVIRHISDRIAVMYLGRIVEIADKKSLFENPLHPYTQALISAVPVPNPEKKKERIVLGGDVPSPANPPVGCAFHPRCRHATELCTTLRPTETVMGPDHIVACHLYAHDERSQQA